jgi:ABC-type phosphonate transport system ATPase subunit
LQRHRKLADPWVETGTYEYALTQSYRERQRILKDRIDAEEAYESTDRERREKALVLEAKYDDLRAVSEFVTTRQAEAVTVRQELAVWESYNQLAHDVDYYETGLCSLEHELASHKPPDRPPDYLTVEDPDYDELRRLMFVREQLKDFIDKWERTGKMTCGECGTPAASIQERVPKTRAQMSSVDLLITAGKHRWRDSEAYRRELYAYGQWAMTKAAEKASLLTGLEKAKTITRPARSEEELCRFLEELAQLEKGLELIRSEHQILLSEKNKLEGRLEILEATASVCRAKLDGTRVVMSEEVEAAEKSLIEQRQQAQERDYAKARLVLLDTQINDDAETLDKYNTFRRDQARASYANKHLEEVREQFHRDNLPNRVVGGYMELMKSEINDMLTRFDAQFRVHAFDDWRFMVRLPSGRVHSARRLSGGQKVLFALAYRIVVNSTFAKELGLLCLDEPTAGLDEDSLACLDVALGRLRELSKSRGLQVILITHDRNVNLFDRVYDMAAAH